MVGFFTNYSQRDFCTVVHSLAEKEDERHLKEGKWSYKILYYYTIFLQLTIAVADALKGGKNGKPFNQRLLNCGCWYQLPRQELHIITRVPQIEEIKNHLLDPPPPLQTIITDLTAGKAAWASDAAATALFDRAITYYNLYKTEIAASENSVDGLHPCDWV